MAQFWLAEGAQFSIALKIGAQYNRWRYGEAPKDAGTRREKTLQSRLLEHEYDAIKARATRRGLSMSALARSLLLDDAEGQGDVGGERREG